VAAENGLATVNHVVVLMLENRSFDHMLGFLYTSAGNASPSGQPYEGLAGTESNPAAAAAVREAAPVVQDPDRRA
jgi:phospholipase C